MRIISGKHRSRILKTLDGLSTRPMMDKMKESVFNSIGPYFDNDKVLDLFGGSGALTLEAISRGAGHSYIVDMSRDAVKVIEQNVSLLKENDKVTILNVDYKQALKKLENEKFDLVFLDPPFKMNIINELLDSLIEKEMLNEGAIVVCQYVRGNATIDERLKVLKNFHHGINEVTIYKNK